jgi:5-(carboxyamino)imidazole ribonucleotide synthase
MFVVAAQTMGYDVIVVDPSPDAPAAKIAQHRIIAAYDDPAALTELANRCAAVTTEFENVPAESLEWLAQRVVVAPSASAVRVAQDRIAEKTFLRANNFATGPFAIIRSLADIEDQTADLFPAILKRARFGYDGKGQRSVFTVEQAKQAFVDFGAVPCVIEKKLQLQREVSAIVVRYANGSVDAFPLAENWHTNGILDVCIVPARLSDRIAEQAQREATRLASALDYVGVLAVEFFVVDGDAPLLINEMAPRPHNSGHTTIDACRSSQFEAQVRTLCRLPPADLAAREAAVMINILGDAWFRHGRELAPQWGQMLADSRLKLHLYGKNEARRGRKMGHLTCVGPDLDEVLQRAHAARNLLRDDEVHGVWP